MPNYKDQSNKLHVIATEFAYLLPPGCVEITDAEAETIANPPSTLDQITAAAQLEEYRTAKATAKADAVIQNLVGIQTLAQCNTFCTNNFPSLTAPERGVMSKIVFALSVLAKQTLR